MTTPSRELRFVSLVVRRILCWLPTLLIGGLSALSFCNVVLDHADTTDLSRLPAAAPSGLDWLEGDSVGPFVRDRVAFRREFRGVHGRLLRATGDGTEEVVRGAQGWLFHGDSLVATEGPNWLPGRPARAVVKIVQRVQATGRRAFFLPAPNKASVYSRFLLPRDQSQQSVNDGRLARVRRLARERGRGAFVDVFEDLQRIAHLEGALGGPSEFLYYPTDTHWNVRGAAVAASKLLERLGVGWEEDALRLIDIEGRLDLASLLGLPGSGPRLSAEVLREGVRTEIVQRGREWRQYRSQSESEALLGHLVMVHDSFGDAFRLLLPAYFDSSTFIPFGTEVTDDLGALLDEADIFVLVTVERTFVRLSGSYPAPLWPQTREIVRRFESSPRGPPTPGLRE